jgi:hypothetical protein
MAGPVGPPAPPQALLDDVAAYLRSNAVSGNVQNVAEIGQTAVRSVATASAAEIGSAESAGAVGAIEGAGAAAADFSSIALIPVAVLAILVLDLLIDFAMIPASVHIPFLGRPFLPFAQWIRGKLDVVYTAITGWIKGQAIGMLGGFLGLFDWAVTTHSTARGTTAAFATQAQYQHVQREADQLWRWLQIETQRMNHLEALIGHPVTIGGSVPASLKELIEADHALIRKLEGDLGHANQRITDTNIRIDQTNRTVAVLTAALVGTRAVSYGVPDVQTYIEHLSNIEASNNARLVSQVGKIEGTVTRLEPLLQLETYGGRGIDNLVTLSNDMCQCPKLPDIPDLLPEILAAETAIKDGF